MTNEINQLGWFLLGSIGLWVLQRKLHIELQSVLLLITRRIDLALAVFAILFLPGVFLHELSHYLMARLLKVPVGRFSIMPQSLAEGRLRLGYVETASTDFARDALIGAAPLITGCLFIAYIGLVHLDFDVTWTQFLIGGSASFSAVYSQVINKPDFWIWFYIVFVISSTMFPSATDRRAWSPVLLLFVIIILLLLVSGAGVWFWEHWGSTLLNVVHFLSLIFVLSAITHLILLVPVWVLRISLERIFNLKVV